MKVALIKCPWWVRYCPPYILAYFAAWLRAHRHSVACFDLNNSLYHDATVQYKVYWDNRDFYSAWENEGFVASLIDSLPVSRAVDAIISSNARVFIFDTHTPSVLISYHVAALIKERKKDSVIVFIGHKASRAQMAFDFIRQPFVDYVCPGEADLALLDLLTALEKKETSGEKDLPACPGFLYKRNGEVVDGGTPRVVDDINQLPFPDYTDFAQDIADRRYAQPNRLDILDSRGCINACHFCYERLFWPNFRFLSAEKMFEQISDHRSRFPQIDYYYFNGLLINGNLKNLESFCDLVIAGNLRISWAGQAVVRADMTKDLLVKMKKAGCQWLGYGLESGSQIVLDGMNKRVSVEAVPRVLRDTKEAGIVFQINLMFGFPNETEADFQQTLKLFAHIRPWVDSILASQSFFTLEKETFVRTHPEQFGIVNAAHHLYWKSDNGLNTYAERFRRYEEFCQFAVSLGIPETSGVLRVKPDKWFLLGNYYLYEHDFMRAAECFERSIADESDTATVRDLLARCRKEQASHEQAPTIS